MPPYGRGIPKAGTRFEGSPDGKMAGACCLHPNGGLRQMAEEREIGSASLSWSQPLCRSRDGLTLARSSQLEKWFTINHIDHGFRCQGGQSMLPGPLARRKASLGHSAHDGPLHLSSREGSPQVKVGRGLL